MKIELNLALAESPREHYALWWAVPALVLGLAGLLYLGHSTTLDLRRYRDVHEELADYQEQEGRLRDREAALRKELEQPQNREVLREVQFVNGLIGRKKVSLTDLATRVSNLLPDDARLTGLALAPQADQLTVRFVITGKSVDAVESFISNLEDSSDFKDPVIANQGFEEEGGAGTPETITCSARYTPGAEWATPAPSAKRDGQAGTTPSPTTETESATPVPSGRRTGRTGSKPGLTGAEPVAPPAERPATAKPGAGGPAKR